jgi:hypothetical protein
MTSRTYPVYSAATRHALAANIASLPVDGVTWHVTIRKHGDIRSSSQNARFHAICRMVSDEIGDDVDSVKTAYKDLFLDPGVKTVIGRQITVYQSTSKMTVEELGRFMDRVEAHAATTWGIFL